MILRKISDRKITDFRTISKKNRRFQNISKNTQYNFTYKFKYVY